MKKLICSLFFILSVSCVMLASAAEGDVRVIVSGENVIFDQPPIIDENGRTLVPVRAVSEAMDAEVSWDGNRRSIMINRSGVIVSLYIGTPYIYIGNEGEFVDSFRQIPIDTAPAIVGGRTLLPIRAVIEALGGTVYWAERTRSVYVMTGYKMLSQKTAPNISWDLYSDGTMIVSGIGNIASYSAAERPDWYAQKDRIRCVIIENGITGVGSYAFSGLELLSAVVISGDVTTIGPRAFAGCPALWDLTLSEGLLTIEDHAFYNDTALTAVSIPASVLTIGDFAFAGCEKVSSVTFSEGLISIGQSAFLNNAYITELVLPNSLKTIHAGAFTKCRALLEVTIPRSVTNIEMGVFNSCAKLKTIYGYKGTEAERIATEKRCAFIALD